MKLDFKTIARPALILFVICLVASAALAGTNALTADKIVQAQLETAEASRKIVLPDAQEFESADGYNVGKSGGSDVGYVFETESKGYGGTVKVMTGIDTEGKITGVVILSHSETPGLGANAENQKFLDGYKQDAPPGGIEVIKNTAPASGQIEALTGATITSQAVTDAVNLAIEKYEQVKGGA